MNEFFIWLAIQAASIALRAQREGREPNQDDIDALKRSDEFRAFAEAAWQAQMPKPQTAVRRKPPNRAK